MRAEGRSSRWAYLRARRLPPDRVRGVRSGLKRTRADAEGPPVVLDGEIADRGVTHIDALSNALAERRPDRLAYFAFDLLHFDAMICGAAR